MDDGFTPGGRTGTSRRSRRAVLAAAAAAGLAGCLGSLDVRDSDDGGNAAPSADDTGTSNATDSVDESEDSDFDLEDYRSEDDESEGAEGDDGDTDDEGPETVDPIHAERFTVDYGHPVADGLGRRPFLGDLPEETDAVVVEFEDASCEVCATFHERTFPEFESELIDTGRVTLVTRQFPRTAAWAEPATHALEATYARDEDAYWVLRGEYYDTQGSLDADSVLDRTRAILDGTDLDGEAVLADVEEETFEPMVELDLDVRRRAGFFRTPSFFLFQDGEFLTRIVGNQPVSVFENALQL